MEPFEIRVDTSACGSLVSVHDIALNDTWYHRDLTFESGKIYGLVSEHGQGCEYVSYLLGGRVDFENEDINVLYNGKNVTKAKLCEMSFDLEPSKEKYGSKVVRKAIEAALKKSGNSTEFQDIEERFMLTPERYDRKFIHLSGERWRASAAYGYAMNKRIYFAPYNPSGFYHRMCCSSLLKALRELTDSGALVVLPAGSDAFLKHIADEIVYLDREFDVEEMKAFYSEQWGKEWVK